MTIVFRDFTVKKIEVTTGPSIIRTHFNISEDGQELGNVTSCQMVELNNICKGVYIYDTYPAQYKISYTLFDAVKDIIQTNDVAVVNHVCDLLTKVGLRM